METVGLAVGVIALIGTFKDCVDLLSFISAAKSMDRAYGLINTRIDIEKTLLLQWADRVKLLHQDHDKRLDNPDIGDAIARALNNIKDLLLDTEVLKQRYGMKEDVDHGPSCDSSLISGLRMVNFTEELRKRLESLSLDERRRQTRSGFQKLRWAVHDKKKFESLVDQLSYFIAKLNELCPGDINLSIKEMTGKDFSNLRTPEQSHLALEASIGHSSVLEAVAVERHTLNCQKCILECIWFRSMNERRDEVTAPFPATFEWALLPPVSGGWTDLSEWLESGKGLYWVSGKAASGKTTLMKHILKHQKTKRLLASWANPAELTVASFFFRNLGEEHQKSHAGLCRALLYNILDANQHLIPQLLPNMWREAYNKGKKNLEPPSITEINTAFETFASISNEVKFFFLIDGLDEYDGNYMDSITFLKTLTTHSNVKVLVSSRPITPCFDAFSNGPRLKLEELNRPDITTYVEKTINTNDHMKTLLNAHPEEGIAILNDLVERSAGIFLWVVLACRSILEGLAAGDYIAELRHRVDELPPELEQLFSQILRRITARYKAQAIKFLQIALEHQRCHETDSRLNILALAMLDEHQLDVTKMPAFSFPGYEAQREKCVALEKRIRSRCCGLLEIVPPHHESNQRICPFEWSPPHPQSNSTVRFLHRSLFEFLQSTESWIPPISTAASQEETFNARMVSACLSLYMAWLTGEGASRRKYWTTHILLACADAPRAAYRCVATLFRKVERLARDFNLHSKCAPFYRTVSDHRNRARCGRGVDVVPLLAVEARLVDIVVEHVEVRKMDWAALSEFSLLYHAIESPTIATLKGEFEFEQKLKGKVPTEMLRLLLSKGCSPNTPIEPIFSRQCTPWQHWLRSLSSDCADTERLEATRLFIEAGANLSIAKQEFGEELESWARRIQRYNLDSSTSLPHGKGHESAMLVNLASQLLDLLTRCKSRHIPSTSRKRPQPLMDPGTSVNASNDEGSYASDSKDAIVMLSDNEQDTVVIDDSDDSASEKFRKAKRQKKDMGEW